MSYQAKTLLLFIIIITTTTTISIQLLSCNSLGLFMCSAVMVGGHIKKIEDTSALEGGEGRGETSYSELIWRLIWIDRFENALCFGELAVIPVEKHADFRDGVETQKELAQTIKSSIW